MRVTPGTPAGVGTSPIVCEGDGVRERRPYPAQASCGPASGIEVLVGDAIEHDPGYMNTAIPYDYGADETIACADASSGFANFNNDALLMAGHTCHRCLPEPCQNGGTCTGAQEKGFTCKCLMGFTGDV